MAGPPAFAARAAVVTHPACHVSQIKVTAGATLHNASYDQQTPKGAAKAMANEAVPVYFYNQGAACHLLMGAPSFRAVKKTTSVATTTVDDLSIPVGADNENRVVVTLNAVMGARCDPATTSGLLVGDYANPIAATHLIVRTLQDVCFYSGIDRIDVNDGAVWVPTR